MRTLILLPLLTLLVFTSGCQEETSQPVSAPPQPVLVANDIITPSLATVQEAAPTAEADQGKPLEQSTPSEEDTPRPPITEDFQGDPQLTLFPRVGDFRPADDSDRLPYWDTFIDHLVKVTGIADDQTTGNRAWVFRSINSIDSVGYFSPLGVKPQTKYQVSFKLEAELTEGASTGVGVLEFDEFLWIPGQYTEEVFNQHFIGAHEGQRLTGKIKGEHSFTFTTGHTTRMIHLILFREGKHDRGNVMFDDIKIEELRTKD